MIFGEGVCYENCDQNHLLQQIPDPFLIEPRPRLATKTQQHYHSDMGLATVHHAYHSPRSRPIDFPFCSEVII